MSKPLTLTIPEAAELLEVPRLSAYRMAQVGELPTIKLGTLRVPVAKLETILGTTLTEVQIAEAVAKVEARRAEVVS